MKKTIILFLALTVALIESVTGTTLPNLTDLPTITDDDLFYVVDDPSGTPADRKATMANVNLSLHDGVVSGQSTGSLTNFTGGEFEGDLHVGGQVLTALGSAASPSIAAESLSTSGIYFGANQVRFSSGGVQSGWAGVAGFGATTDTASLFLGTAGDTILTRDAANTFAQRNAANAQSYRIYGAYTDGSNYERLAISPDGSGNIDIEAETAGTGTDDIDITLTPAGTGSVIVTLLEATNFDLSLVGEGNDTGSLTNFLAIDSQEFYIQASNIVDVIADAAAGAAGVDHTGEVDGGSSGNFTNFVAAEFEDAVIVADEAYNTTTWNASLEVPTKNAVRDQIELISGYDHSATVDGSSTGNLTNFVAAEFEDDVWLRDGTTLITLLTNKQPLDAELTALADLTSAADKLPYFDGSESAAVADLTAFGRSIIDDADEATFHATVNLEIGTDVQAYDPDLSTWATVTPTGNIQSFLATPTSANFFLSITDELYGGRSFGLNETTDPGVDVLVGWDDTDNDFRYFTIGSGLAYDAGTDTLSSSGSGAFSDAGNPIVQNTPGKDVEMGDGADVLSGKVEIGGDADQPQFVIEAYSSQTDDVMIIQNDANTEVFAIDEAGLIDGKAVGAITNFVYIEADELVLDELSTDGMVLLGWTTSIIPWAETDSTDATLTNTQWASSVLIASVSDAVGTGFVIFNNGGDLTNVVHINADFIEADAATVSRNAIIGADGGITNDVAWTGTTSPVRADSPTFTTQIVSPIVYVDLIDATGAVDIDIGSGDITDVSIITDGGTLVMDGSVQFPDADASPSVVGELLYDNTISGLDDGGFTWYDDDEINTLASLDSSTVFGAGQDNYVIKYHYNGGNGYFDLSADATGSGSLGSNLSSSTDDILSDNGTMLFGGTGGSNNETLDWDYESTADEVGLSSATGVTLIDSGSIGVDVGASVAASLDVTGSLTNTALTASQAVVTGADKTLASVAYTGAGNVMRTRTGIPRTIYIDAGAMLAPTLNPAESGTGNYPTTIDADVDYFAFDGGATEENAQFKLVMPLEWNASTVKFKFHWSSETGSTAADTVEWGVQGVALADNDAIETAWGTAQVISDALHANDGADMQHSSATPLLTIGNTPAAGEIVLFQVYRNTDGTDDMTEDAWLFGVTMQYTENATEPSAW